MLLFLNYFMNSCIIVDQHMEIDTSDILKYGRLLSRFQLIVHQTSANLEAAEQA
ncbi:hypothetical protein PILCRDRAFT_817765, partial [Piloderma croceum F 1598]